MNLAETFKEIVRDIHIQIIFADEKNTQEWNYSVKYIS